MCVCVRARSPLPPILGTDLTVSRPTNSKFLLKLNSITPAGKDNFCRVNLQPKQGCVIPESDEEEEDEGSKGSGGGASQNLRMLRKREAMMAAKAAEAKEKNAGQCGSVYNKSSLSTCKRTIPSGKNFSLT